MAGGSPQHGGLPFVGRDAELARLRDGLEQARGGRGRLFLIAGEPGIGKTRLVDELARAAEERGLAALWGRCWESGGAPAYWPWVPVLRSCTTQLDDAQLDGVLAAAPDLAHIVPDLRRRVGEPPDAAPSDPEQGRFRILDAAASLLRAAARARPLLILLDDLHAADQSSLLLLRFVARELRGLPVMVAGTYRESEAERDAAVAPILGELLREGDKLPLRGLDAGAVAAYLSASTQRPVDDSTLDAICAVTEGNPLFLGEVVHSWSARPAAGDEPAVPEGLRAAIRQRLRPLSPALRRVLEAGAVQGREFDEALVAGVLGDASSELPAALDRARDLGLIAPAGAPVGRFRFDHMLIREVLYDDLTGAERAALHLAMGEALEQTHAANLAPHLAAIAHHYVRGAGERGTERAIEFSRRAGDRSLGMLAYEDAARSFQEALHALVSRRGGPADGDGVLQCELLLSLGDALWGAGDLAGMRETFLRAAEAARALPRELGGPRLARAALGLGGRQQRSHVSFDVEIVSLLEEALALLDDGDGALRARVLARLAYALYTQEGSLERRRDLCRQAVEMARRVGDAATLRWVLNDWRWALWGPDTIEERLATTSELVRLADRTGDRETSLGEHAWRMVDLLELGDLSAFEAELATYTRLAHELPRPWYDWYIGRFNAMRALLQGRFDEAERLAEEALAAIQRSQHQDAFLIYGSQMLAVRIEQGRAEELEAGVQAFAAQYPGMGIWRYVVPYLHAELERPAETRAELARLKVRGGVDLPGDYLRIAAGAYAAEACAFAGDAELARVVYDLLHPYADRCVMAGFGVVCLGSVSRYLGMLAATLGRRDEARAHFEAALALNGRLRARPALARTQLAFARLLATDDASEAERGEATALIAAAHATAAELGMRSVARRAAALAAAMGLALDGPPSGAPLPAAGAAAAPVCRIRREGEYWTIALGAEVFRLRHLRGLSYIEHLLRHPGLDVHVFDLLDAAEGVTLERGAPAVRDDADTGPLIDATARAAYKERLRELREELAEAEEANDIGRAERYRGEIEQLAEHLSAATGLGGRDRGNAKVQANRARVAVAKAIRVALERIGDHSQDLARHLDLSLSTGAFCCYTPDPLRPIRWDLD